MTRNTNDVNAIFITLGQIISDKLTIVVTIDAC